MNSDLPTLGDVLNASRRVLRANHTSEIDRQMRHIFKRYSRALRGYARAGRASSIRATRSREYLLSRSPAAKIVSYLLAYPNKAKTGLTFGELQAEAFKINPRAACLDPVRATIKGKPDGGTRIICSFSKVARGTQTLAATIILARAGTSPYEYVRKGRGRDAAAAAGLHAINHHGVKWLSLSDVKGFFPSCTREMAYSVIPTSRTLLNNAVFVPNDTPITFTNTTHTTFEHAVRSGLIEGSRTSGIVAQKIMEDRLKSVAASLKICHGDNVMIGARTEAECLAIASAFASSLEKHPDSPLQLKESIIAKVGEPCMDFCGYRLRPKNLWGNARATPSRKAFTRYDRRMFVRLFLCDSSHEEQIVETYTSDWAQSFGIWRGRSQGCGLAEICTFTELVPMVRQVKAMNKAKELKFSSFVELKRYVENLARALIPHSITWQTI